MIDRKSVDVALLGCGAVAELYYAKALAELEKASLVRVRALYDPSGERVDALQKLFPAAIRCGDARRLADTGVALAIVASPARFHASQTIAALEAGISVLCEKPMATTVAEGEAMLAAAEASGRVLAVGLVRRFFPVALRIREAIASGLLGSIESFSISEGGVFRWPAHSSAFFDRSLGGGGVLLDVGVHLLDLVTWWFGQPEEIVYEDDAMGGVEANCRIRMRFAGGVAGEIRLSRDVSIPTRCTIDGERGRVTWNDNEPSEVDGIEDGWVDPYAGFHVCFREQIENVVAVVLGREPLVVSPEEALAGLRLVERCYTGRSLMAMPWLSEQETRAARAFVKGGAV